MRGFFPEALLENHSDQTPVAVKFVTNPLLIWRSSFAVDLQ
jgi:hypothetical protein